MDYDIIRLTTELIAEYQNDGFPADHLQPGDLVWLENGGELYMTAEEIGDEIGRVESAMGSGDWSDDGWQQRRDLLRDALERLLQA